MLYGSQHYISLINRSIKNTRVKGTSKHNSFRNWSSRLERGKHTPLYFCHENKCMNLTIFVRNIF